VIVTDNSTVEGMGLKRWALASVLSKDCRSAIV